MIVFTILFYPCLCFLCVSIQMADRGVVSRFRGREMHCDECIRVTIGTPEENRQFLDMLKRVYAEIAE
jgi:histidinol-phosphate/aromatic aminotransferase/cobyric acid decarboxylase-like protein